VFVRSNGERQVTWDGRPLYRFVSDSKGKAIGNGVGGFAARPPLMVQMALTPNSGPRL
jgi:predicted lipoprotein with Yx(FWY)xxD motif